MCPVEISYSSPIFSFGMFSTNRCSTRGRWSLSVRYHFATLALQNGVDVKTVSGMLGHFSAGFTLDTYAHITSAAQRQAAQTMGSVLAGTIQT